MQFETNFIDEISRGKKAKKKKKVKKEKTAKMNNEEENEEIQYQIQELKEK